MDKRQRRQVRTLGCVLVLATVLASVGGCFTAFAPQRDFCTGDPKNTSLPLCKPSGTAP